MRYHFIPTKMTINQKIDNNKCREDGEKLEASYVADENVNDTATLENSFAVSQNVYLDAYQMIQPFIS